MESTDSTCLKACAPNFETHEAIEFLRSLAARVEEPHLPPLELAMMSHLLAQRDPDILSAAAVTNADQRISAVVDILTAKVADVVSADWTSCFVGLSAQEGKRLAKEGVKELAFAKHTSTRHLTYGEVDFFSFASILEQVNPRPGALFVDLGHGTGRAVLAAALLRGSELRECRGVEVLAPLFLASLATRERFDSVLLEKPHLYSPGCVNEPGVLKDRALVTLYQGDILAAREEAVSCSPVQKDGPREAGDPSTCADAAWTDGDFVFVNSTCFSKELMNGISRRCVELRRGSVIVTLTSSLDLGSVEIDGTKGAAGPEGGAGSVNEGLDSEDSLQKELSKTGPVLSLTATQQYPMSWGVATAFFHTRV